MLCELTVRDFATIAAATVRFGPGLNLLTGETGAGKSILIGALNLILGGRASMSEIRTGADKAQISGLFRPPADWSGFKVVDELGIDLESDDSLWIQRDVFRDGRTRCLVNGVPQPVSSVKRIADGLVDILGQHEHQSLTHPAKHVRLLDNYGDLSPLANTVRAAFERVQSVKLLIAESLDAAAARKQRHDLLTFQLQELTTAELVPGEEERLERSIRSLQHAEELRVCAMGAFEKLYAQEQAAVEVALGVLRHLERLADIDPGLSVIIELLSEAVPRLEEAAFEARRFADKVDLDPGSLATQSERLNFLRQLKRKYGRSCEDLVGLQQEISQELQQNDAFDQQIALYRTELSSADTELRFQAEQLSQRREQAALQLERELTDALKELGLEHSRFRVQFNAATNEGGIGPQGAETAEFRFSANPGEELRPLAKVASGGELSRIMLAVKSIVALNDQIPTLIFDEVDAGIGGRTAELVAKKLSFLGRIRQVLCITHLPVIAARADTHLLITKIIHDNRTLTSISELDSEQRVAELARMLGGSINSQETERYARVLLAGGVE